MQSSTRFRDQFVSVTDACALAQGIVDTVREPVLVLDRDLRVIAASRSFYTTFKVEPEDTQDKRLYELGDGQWNIPKLRLLLEDIIPAHGIMEDYEVEQEFPSLGRRIICLNARQIFTKDGVGAAMLLGMEDVTQRNALIREKEDLLHEKDVLLYELQHRISNSLQIIASIILMKAKTAQSEETRSHLRDAHSRVISIAEVQNQLHASASAGPIEMVPYLSRVCESLASAMIGNARSISLTVEGAGGVAPSRQAESLGLIATELVMNSLKHAFPDANKGGRISVVYEVDGPDWKLSVADNGVGKQDGVFAQPKTGLGTGIVKALAHQLDAKADTSAGPEGTFVSIIHATFSSSNKRSASRRVATPLAGDDETREWPRQAWQ
jgi:two-component sensor histidine kinase